MNLNASIIDQQVRALAGKLKDQFADRLNIKTDEPKLRSASFVLLCVKTVLDLTEDEAMDCMTEGGSDFGVDAVEVSDVADGEFTVTLFQGKYKQDLEGDANFPENGITKAIQAVRLLFDPASVVAENKRKRPPAGAPEFLRYGSCFLGMLMGKYLLGELGTQLETLDHRNFTQAKDLAEQNGEGYFQKAVTEVQSALSKLYGGQSVSLQRLSATFRRGDLIEELNTQPGLPLAQPAI